MNANSFAPATALGKLSIYALSFQPHCKYKEARTSLQHLFDSFMAHSRFSIESGEQIDFFTALGNQQ